MGEPIKLYAADGRELNVYTAGQVETLLAGGEWFASSADAEAGKVRAAPTPATAAKVEALEGDVEESAPPARARTRGRK